jgi:hypothetical protein
MPVEDRQVLLGCRQLLRGHCEHIVGDLISGFFVEVVTNARPVRQQMLDRDIVANQRQICTQQRTRGRRHAQRVVVDQADNCERGEPFGAAGDREPGSHGVRYLVGAVSEAIRLSEFTLTAAVHRHGTGETVPVGNQVDRF